MSPSPTVEHVERFLRVRTPKAPPRDEPEPPGPAQGFVTISRQSGAGGHVLAEVMRDVLTAGADSTGHWQVFDQKLCEIVADDPRLADSLQSLLTEDYRSRTEDFFHHLVRPTADQDFVMERVFRTVRMLAGVGGVIIVGRAGNEVTRDMKAGFSLRLTAPWDVRIERLMRRHHIGERQARDRARESDASRARLLKRRFGVDIDDPLRYDAIFNTARISHEEISMAVASVLRHRVTALMP